MKSKSKKRRKHLKNKLYFSFQHGEEKRMEREREKRVHCTRMKETKKNKKRREKSVTLYIYMSRDFGD